MSYTTFKDADEYTRAYSGSMIDVLIFDPNNRGFEPIGRGSGFNWNDDFERIAVEEYGKRRIHEYVPGKSVSGGSFDTFMVPKQNDDLDTPDTFHTKKYMIMEVIAEGFPFEGTPLNVFYDVQLSGIGTNMGPRGLKGMTVPFVYTNRLNGSQADELGIVN